MKKELRLSILFIVVTYLISGPGFYLWYAPGFKLEAAAALAIVGPVVSAYLIYFLNHRELSLNVTKVSLKGILIGGIIPIGFMGCSILIFYLLGNRIDPIKITPQRILMFCIIWTFEGFCEEIGWRGVLLPLLKKIMKLQYACLIIGIFWGIWHYPMVLAGQLGAEHTLIVGLLLMTVETTAVSFILGILSETKIGGSIWTYVSFHAVYNVLLLILGKALTKGQFKYVDATGYIIESVLVVLAIGMWFEVRRNHEL